MSGLKKTAQTVVILNYAHRFGTDVGVYDTMAAAQLGMVDVIRNWADEAEDKTDEILGLLDRGQIDEARQLFEDALSESFEFIQTQVMTLAATAIEEMSHAIDDRGGQKAPG